MILHHVSTAARPSRFLCTFIWKVIQFAWPSGKLAHDAWLSKHHHWLRVRRTKWRPLLERHDATQAINISFAPHQESSHISFLCLFLLRVSLLLSASQQWRTREATSESALPLRREVLHPVTPRPPLAPSGSPPPPGSVTPQKVRRWWRLTRVEFFRLFYQQGRPNR
jgi:hypothetical protein